MEFEIDLTTFTHTYKIDQQAHKKVYGVLCSLWTVLSYT